MDSFLGKVEPLVGGAEHWEVAVVNVPSLNLVLYLNEEGIYSAGSARYAITYPLAFQTRTFLDSSEIVTAAGGAENIFIASSNRKMCVSRGTGSWDYIQIFTNYVDDVFSPSFDLYIFARFVD